VPGRARREDETGRLPLVGREDELRRLLDVAASCRAGRGAALLVIEGESGTGKTRLVEELFARLRLEGAGVSTARAVEADRTESWSGVLTLARGGLLEASGIAAAPAAAIARLAADLPEWAERFPAARPGPEPLLSPGRALVDVLRAAAEEQPVLLAVDDAQWLDRESLLALGAALRDLTTSALGLIVTSSPHVVQPDLDELRARLGRDLPGAVVHLGPLGPQALRQLAHRMLPAYTEVEVDRVARRVGSDTAGIPLLAVEVLRAVALGLDLRATAGAWPEPARTLDQSMPGDLPDAVVAAIRIGFRRLGPEAQKVLAAASVLGDRVSPDLLARSLGLAPVAIAPALDELEWHRWLVCEPRGYGFAARIVRQVVERDMLTTGQRARLRRAAAVE
jgi:predicted ATPase